MMAADNNFALKTEAKPLQIDIITIDNLQKFVIAIFYCTIADSVRRTV